MAAAPCYIPFTNSHAVYNNAGSHWRPHHPGFEPSILSQGAGSSSGMYKGATSYSPHPPPGLALILPTECYISAAGVSALSADLDDLAFAAYPEGSMDEQMKVPFLPTGGWKHQHNVYPKLPDADDFDSRSTCTPPPESIGSSPEEQPAQQKTKKKRLCKAKRDRYRKLVESLVEEVRQNPSKFDVESADLPAFSMGSQESKDKLWATVMKFARV